MSDSEIIWKFLIREYKDDHVVIYLYCCGNVRSPKTAIDRVFEFTKQIFCPAITGQPHPPPVDYSAEHRGLLSR